MLSFIFIIEVQLLIDLDVMRPIASTHQATVSRFGVGPYECLICALEKRYYRFTRKINYQEHFKKHSIGKMFPNKKTTLELFQEISTTVTGISLAYIFAVLWTRFSSSPMVNLLNGLISWIRRWLNHMLMWLSRIVMDSLCFYNAITILI